MTCKYRDDDSICQIYEIRCDNPEENNPENYDFANGATCICGCYQAIE